MEFTEEQLKQKYDNLPPDLREALDSTEVFAKFQAISDRYRLLLDKAGMLEQEVSLVLLGLVPAPEFVSRIRQKLEVSLEEAQKIAGDVNETIFKGFRDSLMRVHASVGEEKREEVSLKPPIPPLPAGRLPPIPPVPPRPAGGPPPNLPTQPAPMRDFIVPTPPVSPPPAQPFIPPPPPKPTPSAIPPTVAPTTAPTPQREIPQEPIFNKTPMEQPVSRLVYENPATKTENFEEKLNRNNILEEIERIDRESSMMGEAQTP
ncbi:MAG: hypothetical protein AAB840_02435, partial [Patescibacteria group bacterium]